MGSNFRWNHTGHTNIAHTDIFDSFTRIECVLSIPILVSYLKESVGGVKKSKMTEYVLGKTVREPTVVRITQEG